MFVCSTNDMKLSMPDEGYTRFREAISTGYIRIYHLKVCSGQRTITFMETHVASRRPFIALLDDLITEKTKQTNINIQHIHMIVIFISTSRIIEYINYCKSIPTMVFLLTTNINSERFKTGLHLCKLAYVSTITPRGSLLTASAT